MSREGFPKLGEDFTGFLHRHPPRPGYPEMNNHVVVDLDDWKIARQILKDEKLNSTPSAEQQKKFQICPKCQGEGGWFNHNGHGIEQCGHCDGSGKL